LQRELQFLAIQAGKAGFAANKQCYGTNCKEEL
jgi:hypothetical protein